MPPFVASPSQPAVAASPSAAARSPAPRVKSSAPRPFFPPRSRARRRGLGADAALADARLTEAASPTPPCRRRLAEPRRRRLAADATPRRPDADAASPLPSAGCRRP
nr:putative zinc finger CCCH domain-containing protein 58 [Lolium perenne]